MRTCSKPGCGKRHRCKGLCESCYRKARRPRRLTTEERYEAKVDRGAGPEGCHPWTAALNEHGYGLFAHDGETLATRWAYKHFVGSLGDSEVVRHTCDFRACQNRRHWVKGSQVQNILDAVERSRQHRPRGAKNVKAKLVEAQVLAIRASTASNTMLANKYGVSRATINSIRLRATWRHI